MLEKFGVGIDQKDQKDKGGDQMSRDKDCGFFTVVHYGSFLEERSCVRHRHARQYHNTIHTINQGD
jgi:hypothetical protein